MKVQLARSELKDGSLLSLLETTSKFTAESEENLQLEKLVADLIVLLLTGGKFKHTVYWLKSVFFLNPINPYKIFHWLINIK